MQVIFGYYINFVLDLTSISLSFFAVIVLFFCHSVSGITGACVSISAGCCSGTVTSGLCPGSSDIKCCTNNPCSTPQGSGTCKQTSACSGTSVPGYCSGPSDLQCCVSGSSTAYYGVDVSALTSSSAFSCLKSSGLGTFSINRGYQSSGKVDSNVCNNLNNAKSAGVAYRDVYLFPCPVSLVYNQLSLFHLLLPVYLLLLLLRLYCNY